MDGNTRLLRFFEFSFILYIFLVGIFGSPVFVFYAGDDVSLHESFLLRFKYRCIKKYKKFRKQRIQINKNRISSTKRSLFFCSKFWNESFLRSIPVTFFHKKLYHEPKCCLKLLTLSDLLQFVPTFLGHPVYYTRYNIWKQFSGCEELTRLSSSLDTSLSWMVRRSKRPPSPPREFHADLNEGRDEREFKTRATRSQTRHSGRDAQRSIRNWHSSVGPSFEIPLLLFKTFIGFQAFPGLDRAEFHRFRDNIRKPVTAFSVERARYGGGMRACATLTKSDDAYQRFTTCNATVDDTPFFTKYPGRTRSKLHVSITGFSPPIEITVCIPFEIFRSSSFDKGLLH